ncbi:uncharacterized protein LOC136036512 [Artemia franciscana]|uniref:uncharacterized protein LOC136036512 n=1 Tax=Artemia franciscana TaxID=6661 RepID=UPI0032DA7535
MNYFCDTSFFTAPLLVEVSTTAEKIYRRGFGRSKVGELFGFCWNCRDCQKMPMPMGAHAAQKVHANMLKTAVEKEDLKKGPKDPGMLFQSKDESAPAYSAKYMTSIWGMYNRYSVYNFKKHASDATTVFGASRDAPPSSFDWRNVLATSAKN